MVKHISARVAWHNDGWNGHICKNPKENTYCVGQHSYPGDMIAETRKLDWETKKDVAGCSCAKLKDIPPCIYSINAFGKEPLTAYSDPPLWFNDDSKRKTWSIPAHTVCIWPYEEMYKEEVKDPNGKFNYEKRLELAKKYFNEISEKSLIFYYANYSNPFSEDEDEKYVLIGISRFKEMGEYQFYDDTSPENKKKYAGGFVWQMSITSNYPDEGFKIPYEVYKDKPEILEKIMFIPENDRNFKFATRHISDDDTLEIVENFLDIVDNLIQIGDKTENWPKRKEWLQSLISELWENRGAYPGLTKVLDYLGFTLAIEFFKKEVAQNREKEAKASIFSFIEGKISAISGCDTSKIEKLKILRQWKLKNDDERKLLQEIFPRFDLAKDQIEKILAANRVTHGIYSDLKEIYENPYRLCEQFVGKDVDDRISFNKIDHGIFPSPELGIDNLAELDSWKRLSALCIERLKKESKHTFVAAEKIIHEINHKLSLLPEWKRHQFNERYLEVDYESLSSSLVIREENGKKYLYIKTVFEDEREIENVLRNLAKSSNISFKSPVTEKHWHEYLYDSKSEIAKKNVTEYGNAIKDQIAVCQKIFNKPICVVAGAAGTGKTTIIKAIIQAIGKAHGVGTSFQLLAPTGKAADRIREKTKKQAATIHSFLAQRLWLNKNFTFRRIGGQKEEGYSTYIIDESSMLDLSLIASLFRSINWNSVQRLIFVGDPNQLPPIGTGKVFADIIDWLNEQYPDSIATLKINIRQMENRITGKGIGILDLASLYIQESNSIAELKNKIFAENMLKKVQEGGDIDSDLRVLFWKKQEEIEGLLIKTIINDLEKDTKTKFDEKKPFELWQKAITDEEGNKKDTYQQVISPYRGELFGIENLNLCLQKFLNKFCLENKGSSGGVTYFDKVIQYRNRPKSDPYWGYNFKLGRRMPIEVYNGEIGFVKPHAQDRNWKWDKFRLRRFQVVFSREEKRHLWIDFNDDSEVEDNLELAYAISVHKAQGSEFERIYFVLPKNKKALLSTELLYTGITRAQKHLTILAEEDISPFITLRRPEKSHLLCINSSLFEFNPVPNEFLTMNDWYEEGKIHHTLTEYMVRSKSEVIIANMLHDNEISFMYETPLFASDGTFYLPDFTITWKGEKYYWEHLGLMDDEEYKNHNDTKIKWYEKFFPGKLITTLESVRLSTDAKEIIDKYFKNSLKS